MYGASEKAHWEEICGAAFPLDNVLKRESIFVFTPHPTSHGLKNEYWKGLGERLREVAFNPLQTFASHESPAKRRDTLNVR